MNENTIPESWAIAIQKDINAILNTMATKEDIRQIREEMATKEDVRRIREEMATKEDLRSYATLSDVREIISGAKNEILKEIDRLRGRTSRVEERIGIQPARA